jgi:hypothetical protein
MVVSTIASVVGITNGRSASDTRPMPKPASP